MIFDYILFVAYENVSFYREIIGRQRWGEEGSFNYWYLSFSFPLKKSPFRLEIFLRSSKLFSVLNSQQIGIDSFIQCILPF